MYAVVRSGSKQYRVEPGQRVRVERLAGAVGDTVELGEVLLVGGEGAAKIGKPLLAGAKAVGKIVGQGRGPKLLLFKMKRRKNYRASRATGSRSPRSSWIASRASGVDPWRTKKDKAALATGATATPSGEA